MLVTWNGSVARSLRTTQPLLDILQANAGALLYSLQPVEVDVREPPVLNHGHLDVEQVVQVAFDDAESAVGVRGAIVDARHARLVARGPVGQGVVLNKEGRAPCPHDSCWHSWKNATQLPAMIVRLTAADCLSGAASLE